MSNNTDKNLINELDDSQLDQVSGGAGNDVYLDEERIPLGWSVTCFDCRNVFQVSHGACPKCGSKHVLMTY